ncbi:MAG TPA: SUF system NifU family Fe-S cluster assembly protein [Candidatus Krumholzibacteria bacterium]|jgi:nitrogen fixation NifU-like protein
MSDLDDLYQDIVLDHGNRPRNFRVMEAPDHEAEGYNPLCGDRIHLYLQVEDGVIADLSIQGSGCAISTASASLLTEVLRGKTEAEARELFDEVHTMITGDPTAGRSDAEVEQLGKLAALSGVRQFPARVKCATLVWHTLIKALDGDEAHARTE